ncbi:hypothetical protein DW196_08480 [Vagococcus sp. AM17-17]|nr:hypothetical protein DW196_08480 [Vagococcus sp. AM17-17]
MKQNNFFYYKLEALCSKGSSFFVSTLNHIDRLNAINVIFGFRHRKRDILIGKIKSAITNITKENTPMNNNTRKLLNLTDDSLIFNGD